ncbi:class I SAM-dependent methyltransferase [Micromonospora soli]|uniref:class I SAM-dependent DNA methyltransferase n=1 Tax=Micromonospora sp. NBRC 110009 TaxID=3061627 RepID=UPI0026741E92|nr:class I SAM-dependent methyltransferase [Micromonospora sp. NBRC 110009]WKT95999.1 class I SAM-dependent methyltransferase [Micromonospora sp. NBRC 110009]
MTEPAHLVRTRAAYDTVAVDYAALVPGKLPDMPLGRAMLGAFAEQVRSGGGGSVADVGCGPGHVTAHLAGLGVDAFGVDLSPRMVDLARRAYPLLRFEVGSMTALAIPDGRLGGVLAWWSTVHTPPEVLPAVFAEFHRALAAGGHALLGFHAGDDEHVRLDHPYGHPVPLDLYPARPERVAAQLAEAGLEVTATLRQAPGEGLRRQQAYVFARKPKGCGSGHTLREVGLSNRSASGRRHGESRRGAGPTGGDTSCDSPSPRS